MTVTTSENIEKLVRELGLKPGEEGLFFGKVKGFPVGFKLIESGGYGTALFHVRSPYETEQKTGGKLSYGRDIDELIADDKVEISLENRIVWLTIVDGLKALADGSAKEILLRVLDELEKADLKGESDRCHYCLKERVWDPLCINGKVAQICPACIEQRTRKESGAEAVAKAVPLPAKGLAFALTGAFVWAAFWIGYDLIFEWLHTTTLHVPEIGIVVVIVAVGSAIGGPIGWSFKTLWKQNQKLALAIISGLIIAAAVVGEILYVTWVIYHQFQTFALSLAWKVLPRVWAESDGSYIFAKLAMVGSSLVIANTTAGKLAKPKIKI